MHILIIGTEQLRVDLATSLVLVREQQVQITWAEHMAAALGAMEYEDIDAIIVDERPHEETGLDQLLSLLPFSTRVMAIVNELPKASICSESGVIFLTPPVKLSDINWFIRSQEQLPE